MEDHYPECCSTSASQNAFDNVAILSHINMVNPVHLNVQQIRFWYNVIPTGSLYQRTVVDLMDIRRRIKLL